MTTPIESQLPQTSYAVLGLLSFGPMSGYDLKQIADGSIGHFYWSPAKSQIYAELRRLKKAGFVTEDEVEQENRPDKRIYAITEEGRKGLANWVNDADLERDVFKSNLMLRIFFGKSGDVDALIRLMEKNLDAQNQKLNELQSIEQQQLNHPAEIDATYSLITVRGGIHLTNAAIAWTNETIEVLRRSRTAASADEKDAT